MWKDEKTPKKKKCTRLWAFDFGYDVRCKMMNEQKKKRKKKELA